MATFEEMRAPTRFHGMQNKQDLPKGHKGRFSIFFPFQRGKINAFSWSSPVMKIFGNLERAKMYVV